MPVLRAEYIGMIPEFHGEVELLSRFITTCDKLVSKFYNTADSNDFQNEYLMSSILAKIKGDAQNQITNCIITTWDELKTALVTTYSDKRDIFTLTIELTHMKQMPNETAFDFYNRINNNLNLQYAYIKNKVGSTAHNAMQQFSHNLGLRVLLRGLREPLGPLIRTRDPKSLGEVLSLLNNEFQIETTNFYTKTNNTNFHNNNNSNSHHSNNTNLRNNNKTNSYNNSNNSQRNRSINHNNFQSTFNNRPFFKNHNNFQQNLGTY